MKGIVFTELLDMVEGRFGMDMVDDILDDSKLSSGGAYTTVGTYDYKELLNIVSNLSHKTKIPVKDLVYTYGHHLFSRFHALMPQFFVGKNTCFDFLQSVDGYIHVEVKKLYPDASLPRFKTDMADHKTLVMTYMSQCPFSDFAHGLIQGCIDFYQEKITIEAKDNNSPEEYSRIFTLKKNG